MGIYYKVPVSYYYLYLKKNSKEGFEFTKKKLDLYKNWKRQLVLWALKLRFLSTKKINSGADIIFFGNRKKEFYFDKKKVITFGNCKKDCQVRKKMNKSFHCIKNPKYFQERLEEDLIWPTKAIKEEEIIRIFKKLIEYYKKGISQNSINKIKYFREKRLPKKNEIMFKDQKILSSIVHGDFWKGNIEKDKKGVFWIFDWGQRGMGTIFEDFFNYFLIEYFYTKKLNSKLFINILKVFSREFRLKENEIINLINLETKLNRINRNKSQWLIINRFKNEIKNIFPKSSTFYSHYH